MMLRCWSLFVWLLLVLLNFNSKSVYPLSLRAFSYWYLEELATSSLHQFLDERSLIIFGNWLIIFGGWFEDLLIYNNKSLINQFNAMSIKSTILKLVFTSMAKPISLNILIIFLRIWFICLQFAYMSSPSSLWRSKSFLLISFAKKHKM